MGVKSRIFTTIGTLGTLGKYFGCRIFDFGSTKVLNKK
jgi:hypothetical protein